MLIISDNEILDLAPNQDISISLANSMFESNRVPIAISTPIEFCTTETTCRIFQYNQGPFMKPQRRKLPAIIVNQGITLWTGELQREEVSDRSSLRYTFVGAEFEEVVSGNLTDIEFPTQYQNIDFPTMVTEARKGSYPEFGLPMLIRKALSAKNEYKTTLNIDHIPECSSTDKYANWLCSPTPFIIPAIKVRYLLSKLLPGLAIQSTEIDHLLNYLAVLGLYKNKNLDNRWGVTDVIHGWGDTPVIINLDLADSLPDMSAKDFVLNFLKMTCSTLYCEGKNYVIRSNKSLVNSEEFVDWTDKVSDIYSFTDEAGQGYSLQFQNEQSAYSKTHTDTPGGNVATDNLPECENMMEVLDKFKTATDFITVKHKATGDIYTGKKIEGILYYNFQNLTVKYLDIKTAIPTLDIVHQEGFSLKDVCANITTQKYDCSIDFQVPKCIPTEVYALQYQNMVSFVHSIGLHAMTPIVDFPALGSSRQANVYIGLLIDNNFVDKGIYFSRPSHGVDSGEEMPPHDLSLAIDGKNGLYETLHKPFAEWTQKDKDPRKIDLNLTSHDIANMKIGCKHMFFNQLFFIRNIDFTFSTSSDKIFTTAEIIEA